MAAGGGFNASHIMIDDVTFRQKVKVTIYSQWGVWVTRSVQHLGYIALETNGHVFDLSITSMYHECYCRQEDWR